MNDKLINQAVQGILICILCSARDGTANKQYVIWVCLQVEQDPEASPFPSKAMSIFKCVLNVGGRNK